MMGKNRSRSRKDVGLDSNLSYLWTLKALGTCRMWWPDEKSFVDSDIRSTLSVTVYRFGRINQCVGLNRVRHLFTLQSPVK